MADPSPPPGESRDSFPNLSLNFIQGLRLTFSEMCSTYPVLLFTARPVLLFTALHKPDDNTHTHNDVSHRIMW
jgi:hypothetical protein